MRTAALATLFLIVNAHVGLAQTQRPAQSANPPATAQQARPQVSVQPQAVPPEQRPPQLARTEVAYFDNWQTNCQEFVNPARRQCSAILQLLQTNAQTNSATVLINWVVALADQQLTATIQTPTGVTIAPGVDIKIGRTAKKIPFSRCDAQRCEVAFPIDEGLARDLASAETAEVVLTNLQGSAVTFSIPLKGYDRAAQALRR